MGSSAPYGRIREGSAQGNKAGDPLLVNSGLVPANAPARSLFYDLQLPWHLCLHPLSKRFAGSDKGTCDRHLLEHLHVLRISQCGYRLRLVDLGHLDGYVLEARSR